MQAEHSQRGSRARVAARRRRVAALRGGLALLALGTVLAAAGPATTAAVQAQPQPGGAGAPSRATVIEAQRLFEQLGYPLGPMALGGFGPRTRGALRYFQHKYGLPVTGLPDPHTLLVMGTVAASLKGPSASSAAHASPPHDAVEGVLGGDVPILAIAVCLAALLGVLALTARHRPA
jgi:peptidoglycan hydrolase-like protein with peptidoglycan-binding domain